MDLFIYVEMFENLLTTLKNHSNNLADNLKWKSRRITSNLSVLKTKKKGTTTSNYYKVAPISESDYFNNDYLSPRACSFNYNSINNDNVMEWLPYVPTVYDEQNIVDRFIRVITIDEDVRLS